MTPELTAPAVFRDFEAEVERAYPRLLKDAIKHGADPNSDARNGLAVEDVLQATLIEAWRALPTFKGKTSFYTWLVAILRNVIRDRIAEDQDHRREQRLARHVGWQVRHERGRHVQAQPALSELDGDAEMAPGEYTLPDGSEGGGDVNSHGYLRIEEPDEEDGQYVLETSPDTHPALSRLLARRAEAIRSLIPDRGGIDESPVLWAETHQLRARLVSAMEAAGVPPVIQAALWRHAAGASWGELAKELGLDRKHLEYQARTCMKALRDHLLTTEGPVGD